MSITATSPPHPSSVAPSTYRWSHDPVLSRCMRMAQQICEGHTVDGTPAWLHALSVAQVLHEEVPQAPTWMIGAALLHDYLQWSGESADQARVTLTDVIGFSGWNIVDAMGDTLAQMHSAQKMPIVDYTYYPYVLVLMSDQIATCELLVERARAVLNPCVVVRSTLSPLALEWMASLGERAGRYVPEGMLVRHRAVVCELHEIMLRPSVI